MLDEEAVAAADKEMEERANRAKELLSRRYHGLKQRQVGLQSCPDNSEVLDTEVGIEKAICSCLKIFWIPSVGLLVYTPLLLIVSFLLLSERARHSLHSDLSH